MPGGSGNYQLSEDEDENQESNTLTGSKRPRSVPAGGNVEEDDSSSEIGGPLPPTSRLRFLQNNNTRTTNTTTITKGLNYNIQNRNMGDGFTAMNSSNSVFDIAANRLNEDSKDRAARDYESILLKAAEINTRTSEDRAELRRKKLRKQMAAKNKKGVRSIVDLKSLFC